MTHEISLQYWCPYIISAGDNVSLVYKSGAKYKMMYPIIMHAITISDRFGTKKELYCLRFLLSAIIRNGLLYLVSYAERLHPKYYNINVPETKVKNHKL